MPTPEQAIKDWITETHVTSVCWYDSPEDERAEFETTAYYGVIPEKEGFRLWSVDDKTWQLTDEGLFDDQDLAESHAETLVDATTRNAEAELQRQKEEAWDAEPESQIQVTAPFTYRDNAGYPNGMEFDSEEEVFAFLDRGHHFDEDQPASNMFQCSLVDENGLEFWMKKGPRGEMRIVGCMEFEVPSDR